MKRLCATATFALLLGVAAEAPGEEAERSEEDRAAYERAREHFEAGIRLSDEEHWEAALALFDESLRIYPTQSALYNRGLCLGHLNRYPESIAALEELLSRYADAVDVERRAIVERELERLRGLVGRIAVELDRPGATVLVDGEEVGRTPLESPWVVTAGRHTVEVLAEGFQTLRREVTVAAGAQVTIQPSLAVTEAPGTIRISLGVPGAAVSVDGERVGASPLAEAVSVDPGLHVVTAARQGYEPARAEVEVSPGEAVSVDLRLEPLEALPPELAGSLDVHATERGARLVVDGEPYLGGALPIGTHRLEVVLEGFGPWSRMVEVTQGQPTWIEATLYPDAQRRARYRAHASGVRIASYVLFGLAAAALGTAVGLFVWNDQVYREDYEPERDALASTFESGPWGEGGVVDEELWARVEDAEAQLESIQLYDVIAGSVLGGGLAVLAVATIMILAGPDPDRYAPTVSLAPSPGGLVLALGGALP